MKKAIVSILAFMALITAVSAQENAVGLRVGGSIKGFGMEASYQTFLNDINRIEADLGFRIYGHHAALTAAGGYQWHWFLTGGLGVYGGPAAMMALSLWPGPKFNLGLGGQIGFDYQFDAPIQVLLDFRPTYNFFGGLLHGFDPYVSLGARYSF